MTLLEQLEAEKAAIDAATNEAIRQAVDPNRYRSDADRERLAATDAARIAAEEAVNAARRELMAAERDVHGLSQADGRSLVWRALEPHRVTPRARQYLERGEAAKEALEAAKDDLQQAIREHNKAAREIDAMASARRRRAKQEAGQLA